MSVNNIDIDLIYINKIKKFIKNHSIHSIKKILLIYYYKKKHRKMITIITI